jgi:Tfp pilus assembly protein PilV
MLAFLIFAIILLAAMGLLHKLWNGKRDRQDVIDAQSTSYCRANSKVLLTTVYFI